MDGRAIQLVRPNPSDMTGLDSALQLPVVALAT